MLLHRPHHLYIASCRKDGGIYHYRVDTDGMPSLVEKTPLDNPMHMIASGGAIHALLGAPFNDGSSGYVRCAIGADGHLQPPAVLLPTHGKEACHLMAEDEDVYIVNYSSGSLLRMPDRLVTHTGHSVHPQRQTSAHTHFVGLAPDGRYLLVTDLGLDRIFVYDKALTLISSLDMPAGHGPRHLAAHADGEHIFCVNELHSTVSTLLYHDGTLTLKDTVSLLPPDAASDLASAIRCVGDTVYVANRGHDSVSVLDFSDGKLSLRTTIPTHGHYPRDIFIQDGLLVAAHEGGGVSLISLSDGALVSTLDVPAAYCAVMTPIQQ